MARAYVISIIKNGTVTPIGLRSSKRSSLETCSDIAGQTAKWETKLKHSGTLIGDTITASYEMFYINQVITDRDLQ